MQERGTLKRGSHLWSCCYLIFAMLGVTQAVEATCGVSHQGLIENILPLGWGVVLAAMPDNLS